MQEPGFGHQLFYVLYAFRPDCTVSVQEPGFGHQLYYVLYVLRPDCTVSVQDPGFGDQLNQVGVHGHQERAQHLKQFGFGHSSRLKSYRPAPKNGSDQLIVY